MAAVYEFLARGGLLMIPIVLCSVTALALFIERLWSLQQGKVIPEGFTRMVGDLIRQGKASEAETLCRGNGSTIAQILVSGIRFFGRSRALIKEAMEETGRRETALLERYVQFLGTLASVAPLLGLLGTVLGMIKVFRQVVSEVAMRGQVNPGTLASGIWEALITTAAGLTVAIPTFMVYRYLLSRVDRLAVEMEEIALIAADDMASEQD